ncbi:MAG: FMN-binding protein [Ruminococcaceae bacterium]|nr:FMN-binding protein [Oscillospiraceae bacterium]
MEQTKNRTFWTSFTVGLKLLLICTVVAGLVAFVYALTEDVYAKNLQETKNRAIGEIFSLEAPTCTLLSEDGIPVYLVTDSETEIGYCVEVASAGFGGDIVMMVGYNSDLSVRGVSIVSLSETPGLGARVNEAGFLAQFEGAQGTLVLGEQVDAISGATISSKAVTDGVNAATAALQTLLNEKGGAA